MATSSLRILTAPTHARSSVDRPGNRQDVLARRNRRCCLFGGLTLHRYRHGRVGRWHERNRARQRNPGSRFSARRPTGGNRPSRRWKERPVDRTTSTAAAPFEQFPRPGSSPWAGSPLGRRTAERTFSLDGRSLAIPLVVSTRSARTGQACKSSATSLRRTHRSIPTRQRRIYSLRRSRSSSLDGKQITFWNWRPSPCVPSRPVRISTRGPTPAPK